MEADSLLMCLEATGPIVSKKDCTTLDDDRVLQNLIMDDEHAPSHISNYFENQPDLKPYMRKALADWMVEVCDEQECHEDVIVTALNYLDRVLTQIVPIKRTQLQLLAAACMFIASKFKDSNPISARHLVMYTDWSITASDLMESELIILQALKWELSYPSPYDFLNQILFRIPRLSDTTRTSLRRHSSILIIMCAVDPKFLVCPPSLISAACLCAAASGLMGQTWCRSVKLHRTVRNIASIDKETLQHYQHQIEELLAESLIARNSPSTDSNSHTEDENDSKSPKRQPCTPTDVLGIQLNA